MLQLDEERKGNAALDEVIAAWDSPQQPAQSTSNNKSYKVAGKSRLSQGRVESNLPTHLKLQSHKHSTLYEQQAHCGKCITTPRYIPHRSNQHVSARTQAQIEERKKKKIRVSAPFGILFLSPLDPRRICIKKKERKSCLLYNKSKFSQVVRLPPVSSSAAAPWRRSCRRPCRRRTDSEPLVSSHPQSF